MAALSPPIHRLEYATCARCGRYSSLCAPVGIRMGGWGSKRFDLPLMTCAQCRELNAGSWIVDFRWQPAGERLEPKYDKVSWDDWCAANPPLMDTDLMDDE